MRGLRREIALPPAKVTLADGTIEEFPDYPGMAIWYAQQVVSGRILTGRRTRQCCERFLRMLEKAQRGHFQRDETFYTWSPEDVIDVCAFEESIKHVQGFTGFLELDPWQMLGNAMIWGFRRENGTRLTRLAFEWIPRGAGKSFRSATRTLFAMTCENEVGPLGFICGSKEAHAAKVFEPMKAIVDRDPDFRAAYGASATLEEVRVHEGKVSRVTEVPNEDEGHNPHVVVMEELHKQKGNLWRVMRSSLGKRSNSLFLCISTSGNYSQGIGWEQWRYCEDILDEKHKNLDHISVLMYCADPGDEDDFTNIDVIEKAMPHFGVSIDRDTVLEEAREALTKPKEKDEFLRTRLNIWTKGVGNLFEGTAFDLCAKPGISMESFKGDICFAGADLASRRDLVATTMLFERGRYVVVFTRYYIPEKSPSFDNPEISAMYREWIDDGWLTPLPGGYQNFDRVREDMIDWARVYQPEAIVVDDYQANQFVADLAKVKLPSMVFKKNAKMATEPTDDVLSLVSSRLFVHDGNPVTRWCFQNVVGRYDENGNVLPKRDKARPWLKIDGFDSIMMADAARISPDRPAKPRKSVYETRGLIGDD